MKLVMPHRPTKFSSAQAVTHPLRADLAALHHFTSIGGITSDSAPIPAMHDHHIPHSPERFCTAPIHSDS
jgi:hypothetical protein